MTVTYDTVIQKGGVGKTTVTVNGIFRKAANGERGLAIDMDKTPSLTARFNIDDRYLDANGEIKIEHTVAEFFKDDGGCPMPIPVAPNIDLIAGYKKLDDLKDHVKDGKQRNYLLSWYYQNLSWIEENYDFIWIDNHNDLSLFVDNTIAIADIVVIPVDVDLDSMERISEVDSHVDKLKKIMSDPISGQSYVNAKTVKVGNMVEYNTSDSHAFRNAFNELMKQDNSYLGCFYRRTALKATKSQNKPLTVIEQESNINDKGLQKFFVETWDLYDKIFAAAEE